MAVYKAGDYNSQNECDGGTVVILKQYNRDVLTLLVVSGSLNVYIDMFISADDIGQPTCQSGSNLDIFKPNFRHRVQSR